MAHQLDSTDEILEALNRRADLTERKVAVMAGIVSYDQEIERRIRRLEAEVGALYQELGLRREPRG